MHPQSEAHRFNVNKYDAEMTAAAKADGDAEQIFYGAAKQAKWQMFHDDLLGEMRKGEAYLSARDGIKAAVHTREDVIAMTRIQLALLKRLDRNRNYMVVIILMLGWLIAR